MSEKQPHGQNSALPQVVNLGAYALGKSLRKSSGSSAWNHVSGSPADWQQLLLHMQALFDERAALINRWVV